jgi:hypothetical protein
MGWDGMGWDGMGQIEEERVDRQEDRRVGE